MNKVSGILLQNVIHQRLTIVARLANAGTYLEEDVS